MEIQENSALNQQPTTGEGTSDYNLSWQALVEGTFKVNSNVAFEEASNTFHLAIVVRDCVGVVITTTSLSARARSASGRISDARGTYTGS